ncbi:unnamed protein product, partial [Meganyctiphanes norvegica]
MVKSNRNRIGRNFPLESFGALGAYIYDEHNKSTCLFSNVFNKLILKSFALATFRSIVISSQSYKSSYLKILDGELNYHIYNLNPLYSRHALLLVMIRSLLDFIRCNAVSLARKSVMVGLICRIFFHKCNYYNLKRRHLFLKGLCQKIIFKRITKPVLRFPGALNSMIWLHDAALHHLGPQEIGGDNFNEIYVHLIFWAHAAATHISQNDATSKTLVLMFKFEIRPPVMSIVLYKNCKVLKYVIFKKSRSDIFANLWCLDWPHAISCKARYGPFDSNGFQAGVKVQIKVEYLQEELKEFEGELPHTVHGHIQSMAENKGDVDVYIVELGQRIKVPYMSMVPAERGPPSPPWHANHNSVSVGGGGVPPNYKQLTGYYRKEILPPQQNVKKGRKKGRENISVPTVQNPRFPASDGLEETTATQSTSLPTEPQTTSAATTNKIPNNSSKKGKKKWKQIDFC